MLQLLKIFILVLLLPINLKASNCTNYFLTSTNNIVHNSYPWLRHQLFDNQVLQHIRGLNPYHSRSEFLKLLTLETLKEMEVQSIDINLKNKDQFLNSIRKLLNDKSGITYVEFLVIHHEAAIFFSSQRVSYINQSGLGARLKVRLQKIYDSLKNDNTFSFNIYGDKRYSQLIPFWLSSFPRAVVFPTFAYLDFYSFLELGIDVLPQGMTSNIRVAFDGEENNTPIDFKRHDDNHNETTLGAIDNLSKEEAVEIRRMSRFFRQYSSRITDNERLVLGAVLFEVFHEVALLQRYSTLFHVTSEKARTHFIRHVLDSYSRFQDKNDFGQGNSLRDEVSLQEFRDLFFEYFEKARSEYHKFKANESIY